MDSPFDGAALDPGKCSKLSMEERREIVYELANWSQGAAETLQSWSRQDILQILCAEMGKERKYTGLTKLRIIEHLLKVVSEKKSGEPKTEVSERQSSLSVANNKGSKRPRKPDHPSHLSNTPIAPLDGDNDGNLGTAAYCKNAACKARLSKEDAFCKRCSCCICHKYDDNKDPSLWLTCSSEPPSVEYSCSMSCHLECAIKHERSGIARNGVVAQLDGCFYCVSCAKMNDLMRCWRKQLTVAKDTRRVDILCYRLSLSQKLLSGTKKYREISEMVDDAVKKLEAEVGTLSGVPVKMGRGIVNRLSSGQDVQRLCASAVASFDMMLCHTPSDEDSKMAAPSIIRVEDSTATSVTVILGPDSNTPENNIGYTLWHCKADDKKETAEPTCKLQPPRTRFTVSGLTPATEYIFKAVSLINSTKKLRSHELRVTTSVLPDNNVPKCHSPATNCSTLSNPSSVEDETNNTDSNENKPTSSFNYHKNATQDPNPCCALESDALKVKHPSDGQTSEAITVPTETSLPITPCRLESSKDGPTKKAGPTISHNKEQGDPSNGPPGVNVEYYIKVIRWLECGGHIDKSFRQKFLTWYSIRATPQEARVVRAFIDALIDDPASLSEQLLDTFGEIVSSKRSSPAVSSGFCLKLWH